MDVFKSIFPYDQTFIAEYEVMNDDAVKNKLVLAEKAYKSWSTSSFQNRADVLHTAAKILNKNKEEYATVITYEMGKIFSEAIAEVEKCALACTYYAEHAQKILKDEIVKTDYHKSFISYEPVGAVLAVMPWNFPFWQVFRFAAPSLMAGNVALLKPASNVCGCGVTIEKIFQEAGAAAGVFQTLIVNHDALPKIVESEIVQAVTLTGSEKAGSSFASLAASNIKKSVMELGGSDAFIVLPDADMKQAAKTAVKSRMQNSGQSCIAAKRFIVVNEAHDEFVSELLENIKNLQQGNPFLEETTTGPLARRDLVEKLSDQLNQSVEKGAVLQTGGETDGCNFKPALLLHVKRRMPAFEEETFGPLAAIITAKNEQHAIELANDSRYGLGCSMWTKNIKKGMELAGKIESGSVFINAMVKSDPHLPFGGVKKSGYGRELGRLGLFEFVNAKTIAVNK